MKPGLRLAQWRLATNMSWWAPCLLGLAMIDCTASQPTPDVTVFAAVSLAAPLEELVAEYRRLNHQEVALNLASSSALARQILDGAPADLYISAHPHWLESLTAAARVQPTRRAVAYNQIVAVVNREWAEQVRGNQPFESVEWWRRLLSGTHRVVVGDPNFVPLGMYTKTDLLNLVDWRKLEPRLVPALNAYEASRLVGRGEVPFGFVYASALHTEPNLRAIPKVAINPVRVIYEGVICKGLREEKANEFLEWIRSAQASHVWHRHGFSREQSRQSFFNIETPYLGEEVP